MLEAYRKFGYPYLTILCECSKADLNKYELEAFNIFCPTLNIATEPDIHLSGTANPASKYSKAQILDVLVMLGNPDFKYKDIYEQTSVSISTIRHISNQEAHCYLKEEFPSEYAKMLNTNSTRQSTSNSAKLKGIQYPPIISPTGVEYIVENVSLFAKTHGLDPSCLRKVLTKQPRYNTHKGWKLKD